MTRHWTEDYLGLPYAKGGDDPSGFNCWGFFRHVELEQFGIQAPEISEPEKLSKLLRKVPAAAAAIGWEKVDPPRSGDAVLMAHYKHPSHVGVWVDDVDSGSVLHCLPGAGVVLHSRAHIRVAQWRIISFYRPTSVPALEVPGHG